MSDYNNNNNNNQYTIPKKVPLVNYLLYDYNH